MTIQFFPGMGEAVAKRTILRQKPDGTLETWRDVAARVSEGNAWLDPIADDDRRKRISENMFRLMDSGVLLMSGRHLQHGDTNQPENDGTLFANCASACQSFLKFLLLNCGSGVGRCYWTGMYADRSLGWDDIDVVCVLSKDHPDFREGVDTELSDVDQEEGTLHFWEVPDSREGWAKALELWENPSDSWQAGDKLVLDFSNIRPKGSPIKGMQGRPASGPAPVIDAFRNAMAYLRGAGRKHTDAIKALNVDHFFAECVVVGGARRSARIACMHWRDVSIFDFINAKRPPEFIGKSGEEVAEMRASGKFFESRLWSANNSILVDNEFWVCLLHDKPINKDRETIEHARAVFNAVMEAAYYDGTGEPGFINIDNLDTNCRGIPERMTAEKVHIGSSRYRLESISRQRIAEATRHVQKNRRLQYITNPCGEIVLHSTLGGFCVIGDVVPFHAETIDEACEGFAEAGRALVRANLMDSLYASEVRRTNRIGICITGVHEFAAKFFGLDFRQMISSAQSSCSVRQFWQCIDDFRSYASKAVVEYCAEIGVREPHTAFAIKPSGTVSKLFGITEGWHLPSMRRYIRWVQFQNGSEVLEEYKQRGYPWRELKTYAGVTIVGFPTEPVLSKLLPDDRIVTAVEATMAEQYRWLRLGERHWIGHSLYDLLGGNQISYTMKFDPAKVTYQEFREAIWENQDTIRCCSLMPQSSLVSYEYQPEEPVSKERYEEIVSGIRGGISEDIGREHVDCANGACPVDFNDEEAL